VDEVRAEVVVALGSQHTYLLDQVEVRVERDGKRLCKGTLRVGGAADAALELSVGDPLLLTSRDVRGHGATRGADGKVDKPALIACTLGEALQNLELGQRVSFDDGKLEAVVEAVKKHERDYLLRVVRTQRPLVKLRPEKGINLPDTEIEVASLTDEDRRALPFVAKHADVVGLSFARKPDDIRALHEELERLGRPHIGLVLKIETRAGFENLPRLLLAGMMRPPVGVMIARGDLAVEVGFERLAELQEEILWLCEAAHVPAIWATQVLDTLARTGVPSRAEVTDAAASVRCRVRDAQQGAVRGGGGGRAVGHPPAHGEAPLQEAQSLSEAAGLEVRLRGRSLVRERPSLVFRPRLGGRQLSGLALRRRPALPRPMAPPVITVRVQETDGPLWLRAFRSGELVCHLVEPELRLDAPESWECASVHDGDGRVAQLTLDGSDGEVSVRLEPVRILVNTLEYSELDRRASFRELSRRMAELDFRPGGGWARRLRGLALAPDRRDALSRHARRSAPEELRGARALRPGHRSSVQRRRRDARVGRVDLGPSIGSATTRPPAALESLGAEVLPRVRERLGGARFGAALQQGAKKVRLSREPMTIVLMNVGDDVALFRGNAKRITAELERRGVRWAHHAERTVVHGEALLRARRMAL
jgi:hypothetical protein